VRFFNVTIPTGIRISGKSMGRALIAMSLPANLIADSEVRVRNRPSETRAMRAIPLAITTVAFGKSSPAARKASASTMPGMLGGASVHGSFIRSARFTLRFRDQGFFVAATTNKRSA
jgi:hypothetical protein